MEVLSLTVFLSLCLAGWFLAAFIRQATKPRAGAWEHEALLPLNEDETDHGKITERPASHE